MLSHGPRRCSARSLPEERKAWAFGPGMDGAWASVLHLSNQPRRCSIVQMFVRRARERGYRYRAKGVSSLRSLAKQAKTVNFA